jgi:DNA repair protein RadC
MQTRYAIKTYQIVHTDSILLGQADSAEDVVPLLRAILRDACDADREHFVVLAINARNKIVGYKILASGTVSSLTVSIRDILGVAFAFREAVALIAAHSHPSGDATPSPEDQLLTDRLRDAGDLMGIRVLDHIVLASSGAPDSPWRSIIPAWSRPRASLAG